MEAEKWAAAERGGLGGAHGSGPWCDLAGLPPLRASPWADAAGECCRKLAGEFFVIVRVERGRCWRGAREEELRISAGDTQQDSVTAACEK